MSLHDEVRAVDRHVAFLFEWQTKGAHVHVKVRAASRHPSVQVNHSRGLSGELVFARDEWILFREVLERAATPGPTMFVDGDRLTVIAGAGHPALVDVETDHADHLFITLVEAGQPE